MEYSEVQREDIDFIAHKIEEELTHGDAIINEIFRKRDEGRYHGVKVVDDGRIIGFYTYTDDCIDFTMPHPELERRLRDMIHGGKVITGDALYLEPAYQHHGIATEISHRLIAHAKERGAKYLVTEAWMHPDGEIPARETLLHYGTVVYEEDIPMFYEGMEEFGMTCPICGDKCVCGAQVQLHRL